MFKSLIVAAALMASMVGVASASNVIGSGQLCQTFTAKDQGRVTFCTPIIVPIAFSNLTNCRLHFEAYLKQKDSALFVAADVPEDEPTHLQPDTNKALFANGTLLNAFQDIRSYVKYACTPNGAQ